MSDDTNVFGSEISSNIFTGKTDSRLPKPPSNYGDRSRVSKRFTFRRRAAIDTGTMSKRKRKASKNGYEPLNDEWRQRVKSEATALLVKNVQQSLTNAKMSILLYPNENSHMFKSGADQQTAYNTVLTDPESTEAVWKHLRFSEKDLDDAKNTLAKSLLTPTELDRFTEVFLDRVENQDVEGYVGCISVQPVYLPPQDSSQKGSFYATVSFVNKKACSMSGDTLKYNMDTGTLEGLGGNDSLEESLGDYQLTDQDKKNHLPTYKERMRRLDQQSSQRRLDQQSSQGRLDQQSSQVGTRAAPKQGMTEFLTKLARRFVTEPNSAETKAIKSGLATTEDGQTLLSLVMRAADTYKSRLDLTSEGSKHKGLNAKGKRKMSSLASQVPPGAASLAPELSALSQTCATEESGASSSNTVPSLTVQSTAA